MAKIAIFGYYGHGHFQYKDDIDEEISSIELTSKKLWMIEPLNSEKWPFYILKIASLPER